MILSFRAETLFHSIKEIEAFVRIERHSIVLHQFLIISLLAGCSQVKCLVHSVIDRASSIYDFSHDLSSTLQITVGA